MCLHVSCFVARKRAAQDYDLAMVLYQVLLGNLDIQHSRFVHNVAFLQQHNIRRYKQNFQVGGSLVVRWATRWMLVEITVVVNFFCTFLCHASVIIIIFFFRCTRMIRVFWPATSFGI